MPSLSFASISSLFCVSLMVSTLPLLLSTVMGAFLATTAQAKESRTKHTIGAADFIREASTGIPFSARIDTGAATCSLHVEEIELSGEATPPFKVKGKTIRFKIQNEKGDSAWIESKVAGVVRVKSSALKKGKFDRRYKVLLTLQWRDFKKEVLVTLNDRTDMEFPMLIGRNYLKGDFIVDVSLEPPKELPESGN